MGSSRTGIGRIGRVWGMLRRHYREEARRPDWDPVTWLIYAVLSDGTGDGKARAAVRRFQESFVDWNELRVTPPEEIVQVMSGLPQAREKAVAVTTFLNRLFTLTNSLSLDSLADKPKRDARLWLEKLDGVGPVAAASFLLHALGGHAVPVDAGVHRLLQRLGMIKPDAPAAAVQSALERHISHRDARACTFALRRHADEVCVAGEPRCSACVLRRACPTGRTRSARPARPATAARGKAHRSARRRARAGRA